MRDEATTQDKHEAGLLEPALVDAESGYRYYSPAQVVRAEAIAVLRSLDLPLAEIRLLLRDPSDDTVVRVLAEHRLRLEERLSEARERLRRLDELAYEGRWTVVPETDAEIVEVRLDSVRHSGVDGRDYMMLVEVGGRRVLNIWIGPTEADAINYRLRGIERERPMTHDLMANLLRPFDVDVARVVISRFEDGTYRAEVHVRRDRRDAVVDARPSDAVNLAVRTAAPIFVAAPVFSVHLTEEPPDNAVWYELVDEEGAILHQGWTVGSLPLGRLESHGVRGQVTVYEILELTEVGERRIRGRASVVSREQRKMDVPN